ncbi:MAG: hypothetical protein ACRC5A_02105 [Enterobacteriaceae bacterium]
MSDILSPSRTVVQQTYQQIHLLVLKAALAGLSELYTASQTVKPLPASATLPGRLQKYLLPILRNYPAIGRLLLNRPPGDADIQQVHQQLQQKLNGGELREYFFESYVVIYLIKSSTIYLLASHALDEQSAELWEKNSLLN